jgi:hypothetical protein
METLEALTECLGPSLLWKMTDGTCELEDIDLNAEYSDDDRKIHFKEAELVDYLRHVEEDNLFKISMLQDDEEALEEKRKESAVVLASK